MVVADVADYDAVRPAFDGQDAVVHLAAAPKPDDPWGEVYRSNIRGTQNVLAAARNAGVGSVVFASSHHVMGRRRRTRAGAVRARLRAHADSHRPGTAGFDIFHGVSGNRARCFDLGHAADVLGYDPQYDAGEWEQPETAEWRTVAVSRTVRVRDVAPRCVSAQSASGPMPPNGADRRSDAVSRLFRYH